MCNKNNASLAFSLSSPTCATTHTRRVTQTKETRFMCNNNNNNNNNNNANSLAFFVSPFKLKKPVPKPNPCPNPCPTPRCHKPVARYKHNCTCGTFQTTHALKTQDKLPCLGRFGCATTRASRARLSGGGDVVVP